MAFSVNSGGHGQPSSEINVVPLVDVMLVLLIIFMVTTPLMSHKVEVELPETDMNRELVEDKPQAPPITIAVTEDNKIFFNDEPITLALLESRLSVEAQRVPQPALNIRGDKTTPYRFINDVVNIAQAQGMRKVGYISLPEK